MNERIDRLVRLTETWPRVCIGSTSIYADVLSPAWQRRMDESLRIKKRALTKIREWLLIKIDVLDAQMASKSSHPR